MGGNVKRNMKNVMENSMMMNDMVTMVAIVAVFIATMLLRNRPTVGIELEVIRKENSGTPSMLARWIARITGRNETSYRGYTHDGINDLKVVSDGSLNYNGVEIVTPVMKSDELGLIHKICDSLRGLATADASCGIHAHVGVLDTVGDACQHWSRDDPRWPVLAGWTGRILQAYGRFEPAISTILAPSRTDNRMCKSVTTLVNRLEQNINYLTGESSVKPLMDWHKYSIPKAYQLMGFFSYDNRYYTVNPNALHRYGTIEYRQHGGTTNPKHIAAWTQLMVALTLACRGPWSMGGTRNPQNHPQTLNGLFAWLGIGPEDNLFKHWSRRQQRFNHLLNGKACDSCNRQDCDGDDYCRHTTTKQPEGYAEYVNLHEGDDDEWCGYCEEPESECEC